MKEPETYQEMLCEFRREYERLIRLGSRHRLSESSPDDFAKPGWLEAVRRRLFPGAYVNARLKLCEIFIEKTVIFFDRTDGAAKDISRDLNQNYIKINKVGTRVDGFQKELKKIAKIVAEVPEFTKGYFETRMEVTDSRIDALEETTEDRLNKYGAEVCEANRRIASLESDIRQFKETGRIE